MIPFVDKLLGYGLAIIACTIFGFIVFKIAKKEKAKNEERVKSLTEEQKQFLINAPVTQLSNLGEGVIVKGLLYEVILKGQKAKLVVLFYNTYFPNSLYSISWADITIPAKELQEHELVQGDYVNMEINPNGGKLVY